jgi:hypothetical protein
MYLQKLRRGQALVALEMEGLPVLMDTLELWWKGYQHEEEKVAATMLATLNGNGNGNGNTSSSQGQPPSQIPPTITITSTAIQAARQNQCRTVAEFLAAFRAEHARVVEQGCGPSSSPLVSAPLSLVPKIVGSSLIVADDKPVQSSSPVTPRLRLKLSSAVTAAAAANAVNGLTSTTTHPPTTQVSSMDDDGKLQSSEPGSPPRLRLKLSSSAVDAAASCLTSGSQQPNSAASSNFCQQESEQGSSTPFRINISVNSYLPHAAPPVPVAVSRSTKTKTKREDVDWYVDEGVDVRDEEWKPAKRSKDPSSSPKSQRVGTASPAPLTQPKSQSQCIGTASRGLSPSPQRAIKKKTTARQRLSKRVGR